MRIRIRIRLRKQNAEYNQLVWASVFIQSGVSVSCMADNLQTTDLDEWEEIGEEVQQIHDDLIELVHTLNTVPKSVWRDDFDEAKHGVDQLKDSLDDRLFKEHSEEASVDTFYGGAD